MRWLLVLVAACGAAPVTPDADLPLPIDIPPDPFVGVLDDPSELPREGCVAGSVVRLPDAAYWPALAMRRDAEGFYLAGQPDDILVEHVLTADDLFVRKTIWNGESWRLRVIAACAHDAGTLAGHEVDCITPGECTANAFTAAPLQRSVGEAESEGLSLVGELGWPTGETRSVRVQQRTAFVGRGVDGVRIVSVSDPRTPFEFAHHQEGDVTDLELVRGVDGRSYLVVAASPVSYVLDVTSPGSPARVAMIPSNARAVSVDGTTAYFVEEARIAAFELSNPRKPKRLEVHDGIAPHGAFAANGVVYVADGAISAVDYREVIPRVLDASEPLLADAAALASLDSHSVVVAISAGELHLLDGDLASPTFLVGLGAAAQRPYAPLTDVRASGDRAYVASARDGMRVFDVANPHAPVLAGYFNSWREGTGSASPLAGAVGVDVDRSLDRIYVADTVRGLLILGGAL